MPYKQRTVLLIDSIDTPIKYSKMISSFIERNHDVQIQDIRKQIQKMKRGDEWQIHNQIILSPSIEQLGPYITTQTLIDFVNDGNSLFIGASNGILSSIYRNVGQHFYITFDNDYSFIDDIKVDEDVHNILYNRNILSRNKNNTINKNNEFGPIILGKTPKYYNQQTKNSSNILYSGIGISYPIRTRFQKSIIDTTDTSFSQNFSLSMNTQKLSLMVVMQNLQNGRQICSGSLEAFSNEFIYHSKRIGKGDNEQIMKDSMSWLTHDIGFLRSYPLHILKQISPIDYINKSNNTITPYKFYTMNEEENEDKNIIYTSGNFITVNTFVEIYDGYTSTWKPYTEGTVYLQVQHWDPYFRKYMVSALVFNPHCCCCCCYLLLLLLLTILPTYRNTMERGIMKQNFKQKIQ